MKKKRDCFRGKTRWFSRLVLTLSVFCFSASLLQAQQNTTRVNLDMKNALLSEVFEQMKQQTGSSIMYSNDDVKNIQRKDYSIKNETVEAAMTQLLKGTGLEYILSNNVIVVRKANEAMRALPVNQQYITIKGSVKDKNGAALPGVTVIVKGTTLGGATDVNGKFELRVPEMKDIVLIFSFIGLQTQEILYKGETELNVIMQEDITQMSEVVVTGIFERKADSYTGAVTTFRGEDLQRVGNQNVLQSLKNLDPSFQVIESNEYGSDPNRPPEIQMRGASNFSDMKDKYQTNPNQPLFIVDGFEQSIEKVMDMDMNRVASITLLKDATAKALYGSKGANGVVVIESVVPEKGKLKVSYSANLNLQIPDLSSYNLANAAEKLEIERLSGVYTNLYGNPVDQQLKDEKYYEYLNEVHRGVNTYWLDKPVRTGVGHKHSLNFEGGDDVIRYGIDFSYNNVAGVMKGSDREVISGGFNFQYRHKGLIFKEQLSVTFNKAKQSPYGNFSEYAKLNPYWRAYNEDGSIKEVLGTYSIANYQGTHSIYNPLLNTGVNTINKSTYTDITNNFYVEWLAFPGMRFKGRLGIISQREDSDLFYPQDHTKFKDIAPDSEEYFQRGEYTMGNGKRFEYNADISANYSKEFNKHLIFANAQWSFSEKKYNTVNFTARGFSDNKMDYITHAKEYAIGAPGGTESLSREISGLISVNYSYDNRYLLDATYRANASSLFGKDKRWGHFWSAGIGWNIHNEHFWGEIGWMNQLRLRASTGFSGSQNFSSYQAIATYKYYNDSYDNIVGSYLMGLANPDLQWQKTQDNNIGIDINLFNRLDVTVDYYVKNTENLLTPVSLPPSAGFTSYTENLGETENKGIEFKVNYRVLRNAEKNMYLSVFASGMHNKNKITKISDALNSINKNRDDDKTNGSGGNPNLEENSAITKPSVRYAEGQSLNAIWGVRSYGIDPATGKEIFISEKGIMVDKWNANDQVVIGDKLPKLSGTFGFNFEYKGFSVNTSFFYKLGGEYYNQTLVDKVENADIQYNVDKRMLSDRWSEKGVPARFRKFSINDPLTRPTSRFVQDLNELQMTSLNVGYDFREWNFVKQSKLERLKLQFYMNDVFRVSTVKAERGIEYPFARSCSFALQLTF